MLGVPLTGVAAQGQSAQVSLSRRAEDGRAGSLWKQENRVNRLRHVSRLTRNSVKIRSQLDCESDVLFDAF
jgi:hypothetical protein